MSLGQGPPPRTEHGEPSTKNNNHKKDGSRCCSKKKKMPGRNGYRYRQQFGVIVICKNERHQARVYNVLRRRGLECKVVTV